MKTQFSKLHNFSYIDKWAMYFNSKKYFFEFTSPLIILFSIKALQTIPSLKINMTCYLIFLNNLDINFSDSFLVFS